ncbi:RNA polymerase sigma factor [Caulobacter segnis]
MRNAGEVEDLVQEVFLRLTVRGTPDNTDHASAYIFQTAARRSGRSLSPPHSAPCRRARRAGPGLAGEQGLRSGPHLCRQAGLNAAAAALMTMPERTRTIFLPRRIDGLRHQAIATQLGLSVSAVEKHMVRAIEHLMAHAETPDDPRET